MNKTSRTFHRHTLFLAMVLVCGAACSAGKKDQGNGFGHGGNTNKKEECPERPTTADEAKQAPAECAFANEPPQSGENFSALVSPVGKAFSFTLPNGYVTDPDGDPLVYSLGEVSSENASASVDWVAIDPKTGALSGTPPEEGRFNITMHAEEWSGNVANFLLDVWIYSRTERLTVGVNEPVDFPAMGTGLRNGDAFLVLDAAGNTLTLANQLSEPGTVSVATTDSDGHVVAVVLTVIACPTQASGFAGGDGTAGSPLQVCSASQLRTLGKQYENDGRTGTTHVRQTANLFAQTIADFSPIGTAANRYGGGYDGQGYKIFGFGINQPTENGVGFIGFATDAEVVNLTLADAAITGSDAVGTLFGEAYSAWATDVTLLRANVTASGDAGGVVGRTGTGQMDQVRISDGDISGNNFGSVGGMAGHITGASFVVTGSVLSAASVANGYETGGLVGKADKHAAINNSWFSGELGAQQVIGGLLGVGLSCEIFHSGVTAEASATTVGGHWALRQTGQS